MNRYSKKEEIEFKLTVEQNSFELHRSACKWISPPPKKHYNAIRVTVG